MRLKTLRKNRPPLEVEGAVVNGNRMDISGTDLKSVHHRSNTSFACPTSLNTGISYLHLTPNNRIHEMSSHSFQDPDLLTASQSSNLSSYKAIQAAYLQHGIRIRYSPRQVTSATGPKSERKSTSSARSRTTSIRQHSGAPTNVLQNIRLKQHQEPDSGSFDSPHQTSSNDFDQAHIADASDDESISPVNDEIPDEYYSTSFITSQHFPPGTPLEKTRFVNTLTPTAPTLDDDDPDMIYMSSLLKIASVESFRDTRRRHGAVRRTFSARPYASTDQSTSSKQKEFRERSPAVNQGSSFTRAATSTPASMLLPNKIESDIRKHASRMRNSSRDYSNKAPGTPASRVGSSSSRDTSTPNYHRRLSNNRSSKSIGLEPLEQSLAYYPRSASLSADEFPTLKTVPLSNNPKHSVSNVIPTDDPHTPSAVPGHFTSPSIPSKGSLSLMQTSPFNLPPESNVFSPRWHDRGSSVAGDGQSLTSSSVVQIPSSILSGQLNTSASRRANKKVSFYEEPRPLILTTTTYV